MPMGEGCGVEPSSAGVSVCSRRGAVGGSQAATRATAASAGMRPQKIHLREEVHLPPRYLGSRTPCNHLREEVHLTPGISREPTPL